MPLTDEQKAALQLLAAVPADDLADALHETIPAAHQEVFDRGYKKRDATAGTEIRKIEKTLAAEQAERAKLEERLKESDPEKIHAKYRDEIASLTTQHEAALKAEREARIGEKRGGDLSGLRARLAGKLKPMALKAVLNDPEVQSRLQYGEDGSRRVLQLGKDIDYAPPAGTDALDLLATALIDRVRSEDPSEVLSAADGGAGAGNGGSGGGGYDPAAEGRKMAEAQKAGQGDQSLAFR